MLEVRLLGTLTASLGARRVLRRGRKLVAGGLLTVAVGFVLVHVAVSIEPGPDVALWTALPLLIAGLGSGYVISPNQTLTLSQVPVERAGSAGGVLQTGQRIGSAAGIAVTGSVFYAAVSGGGYAVAFQHGVLVIAAFVFVAFLLAVTDALTGRDRPAAEPAGHPPTGH